MVYNFYNPLSIFSALDQVGKLVHHGSANDAQEGADETICHVIDVELRHGVCSVVYGRLNDKPTIFGWVTNHWWSFWGWFMKFGLPH